MKVCHTCGEEISTPDGENECPTCQALWDENDKQTAVANRRKARANRKAIHDVMSSLGLVRVRGAMGGTYYE